MATFTLRVHRASPLEDLPSQLVRYEVPIAEKMTVLDAVAYAQRHLAPDLAYRYACRVGMCGSCAMVINGREGWACRTLIEQLGAKEVTVEPLRNFPVVKDLVVDMAPFVSAMQQAMAYFVPDQTEPASGVPGPDGRDWANIAEALRQRPSIDPHIECITCGACYSACTMVSWDPLYLDPAALNRAATLVMDPRDSERGARLETLGGEHGCWRCHSQFTCTDVCPMQLRPTEAIGYLKRQLVAESVNEIFGTRTKIAAGAGRFGGMFFLIIVATVSLLAGWGYLVRVGASHAAKDDFNLADQPRSPARLAGALIFEEQSCENCHSVLGQGGRSAPDLWKAGHKHDRAWLRRLFQDPDSVVTAGSMPPFDLEERDLAALVDYVAALDFTRRAPIRVSRTIARGGGEISRSGCLECHDEGAKGPAPRFGGIGHRHTLEWLAAYVKAPAFHEGLASGASALNATRREEIALYLSTR